jgi:hypothetical protein
MNEVGFVILFFSLMIMTCYAIDTWRDIEVLCGKMKVNIKRCFCKHEASQFRSLNSGRRVCKKCS